MAENYINNLDLWIANIFLFNHESPLRSENFVIKKIVSQAKRINTGKINFFEMGDISIKRDWGWAHEYMNLVHLIMQKKTPQKYILGTGKTTSIETVIKKIFLNYNLNYKNFLKQNKKLYRKNEIKENYSDSKKFFRSFNRKPKKDINFILEKIIKNEYF